MVRHLRRLLSGNRHRSGSRPVDSDRCRIMPFCYQLENSILEGRTLKWLLQDPISTAGVGLSRHFIVHNSGDEQYRSRCKGCVATDKCTDFIPAFVRHDDVGHNNIRPFFCQIGQCFFSVCRKSDAEAGLGQQSLRNFANCDTVIGN